MRGDYLTPTRAIVGTGAALGVLLIALLVAAGHGAGQISIPELLGLGEALEPEIRERMLRMLLEVRLPRVALAAILGAALVTAGISFQALLRNPLADPYILGVSGGASLGGVAGLLLGFGAGGGIASLIGIPGLAFLGALGALVLIERVATVGGRMNVHTLLLTGVIFNAFCASVIYFLQSIASLEELHAIVFYLMGHIPSYGWNTVGVLALLCTAAAVAVFRLARDFNALTLGEESAQQLGVSVERVKRTTFLLGSLLTGVAVSFSGMIGFVGLVVPHLLRLLLGPDHRLLLPAGFFGGAAFLVLADLLARSLVAPGEIPVGVITALIGGPFFLVLLRRRGEHYALR